MIVRTADILRARSGPASPLFALPFATVQLLAIEFDKLSATATSEQAQAPLIAASTTASMLQRCPPLTWHFVMIVEFSSTVVRPPWLDTHAEQSG